MANSIFKQPNSSLWKVINFIYLALRACHWFKYNSILIYLRILYHRFRHHNNLFLFIWILHLAVNYIVLKFLVFYLSLLKHSIDLSFFCLNNLYRSICFFQISLNICFFFNVIFLHFLCLNWGRISIYRFWSLFKIRWFVEIIQSNLIIILFLIFFARCSTSSRYSFLLFFINFLRLYVGILKLLLIFENISL